MVSADSLVPQMMTHGGGVQAMARQPMMKLHGLLIMLLCMALVSCGSPDSQQFVVYRSDFQMWTMRPDGTRITKAVELDFATANLKWSPDGTRMAFMVIRASDQSSIWIANSDGSDPRQISEEFDSVSAEWLNDDVLLTRVITQSSLAGIPPGYDDYTNYTYDLQSNTMQVYSKGPEEVVPVPPGDRWLAMNGHSGLVLYDLDGNTWSLSPGLLPTSAQAFDVSSAGDAIIVCHASVVDDMPGLYQVVLEQNEIGEPELVYPMDVCVCARWSPDGRQVALLDNQHVLHILDAASFSPVKSLDIGPLVEDSFIWSPDGGSVAVSRHYGEPGSGPKEIARVNIETGEIIRLTNNDSVEYLADWVSLPTR